MIVMSVVDCINAFSLTDMLGYFDFDAANTIVTIIILQIGLFTTVIAVATELYLNNSSRGLVITLFTMMCIISANFLLSIIVLSGIDIGIVNVLALAAAIASAILSGIYLQNTHRRKVPLAKQLQTYKNLEAQGKITKDEYKEIAIKTIDEA
jgi:hypothetical protein